MKLRSTPPTRRAPVQWGFRTISPRLRRTGLRAFAVTLLTALCSTLLVFGSAKEASAHSVGQTEMSMLFSPDTQRMLQARALAGGGGIQAGDIVEYVIKFTPVPNGATSGPNGYVTYYVPPNVSVVGASFVDRQPDGEFVEVTPEAPGSMPNGWGPRGQVTYTGLFTGFAQGSLSQVYADTGIFYSTDTRTRLFVDTNPGDNADPNTTILSLANGYHVRPSGCGQLTPILGVPGGDCRDHNLWDANMTNVFGTVTGTAVPAPAGTAPISAVPNGRGNTPHLVGSAVAGPQSWYGRDYTNTVGPWNRVRYPGSMIGAGAAPTAAGGATNNSFVPVTPGVNDGRALTGGCSASRWNQAVRWAVGRIDVGVIKYVKVRILLNSVTDSCQIGDSEVFGGDAFGPQTGQDNPWRYHTPATSASAACLFVEKTGPLYSTTGSTVTYNLRAQNTGADPLLNAVVTDRLPTNSTFVSASNGGTASGGVVTFPTIPSLAAGDVVNYTVTVTAGHRHVHGQQHERGQSPARRSARAGSPTSRR